ncbi:BOI-related E3 ubiquitin-protein ligase 1-like [Primulina tabacum]|uniref:BOI-related E3 ubiquitin-protein ligase 1-like n=1 Tax=Primulina tabacum TaxID=48773 RepID=UPI003F59E1F7
MAVRADLLSFENMGNGSFVGCGSQDGVMRFEDGLCFQEIMGHDVQRKGVMLPALGSFDNQAVASSSETLSMEFLQCLSSEAERQNLEMNWFLHLENQNLRSLMQEATRKQAVVLHKHYESRIKFIIQKKDEQLSNARNRAIELQDFLRRAEMEAKACETKATEKEAIVSDLNNKLKQFRLKEYSLCDSSSSSSSTKEMGKTEEEIRKIGCKLCEARRSCVVLFPCKHLCCCTACEPLLGLCPVCGTAKEASLEVFLGLQKPAKF